MGKFDDLVREQALSIQSQLEGVDEAIVQLGKLCPLVEERIEQSIKRHNSGNRIFYPECAKDLIDIGRITGQGIIALISSLDYFFRFLAYRDDKIPSNDSYFPFFKSREDFDRKNPLKGYNADDTKGLFNFQPFRGRANWYVQTLRCMYEYRHLATHNTIVTIRPKISDNNEFLGLKTLPRREGRFLYSSMINSPIEILKRYKKVAITIMQDFLSDTEDKDLATILDTHAESNRVWREENSNAQ